MNLFFCFVFIIVAFVCALGAFDTIGTPLIFLLEIALSLMSLQAAFKCFGDYRKDRRNAKP